MTSESATRVSTPKVIAMPAVAEVLAVQPRARNTYILCDSIAEFADATQGMNHGTDSFRGYMSCADATRYLRDGHLASVAATDKLLNDVEGLLHIDTKSWRNVSDVSGGVPDVPAFLAGQPMCMRRRQRVVCEQAPLAMIVDLTSSASLTAAHMNARGVAILALVRVLANVRPVELWTVIGLGEKNKAVEVITRIDTAPLDLARAAHMMTNAAVTRGLGYGLLGDKHHSGGGWNFGDVALHRKTARASYARVMHASAEVLYVPPVHSTDKSITEPLKWLADMVAQHGGIAAS